MASSWNRPPLEGRGSIDEHDPREDDAPLLNGNGHHVEERANGHAKSRRQLSRDFTKLYTKPTVLFTRLRIVLWSAAFVIVFLGIFLWKFGGRSSSGTGAFLNDIGSDLYIFFHNDLYGPETTRSASAISLFEPKTFNDAAHACEALGESLLDFDAEAEDTADHLKEHITLLKYRKYFEHSADGVAYWLGRRQCMTEYGVITTDCNATLPALCSHSASIPNKDTLDRSPRWHLTVPVGLNFVTGYHDRRSFRFEGIKFAGIPQRFAHSQMIDYHKPLAGARPVDATKFGEECVQFDLNGTPFGEEDCLFLNVFTPYIPHENAHSSRPKLLKPVVVYFAGGGFIGGSGSDHMYDGGNMASRGDVVVVTFNYRTGTLGFLALDDGVTNGNFGIGDQVAALNWVKLHISAFGGDPNKITLMGQSAGAASIRALMGSPKVKGLYHAAILQSIPTGLGNGFGYTEYMPISALAENGGKATLESHGCSDVECLRQADKYSFTMNDLVTRFMVQDNDIIPYHTLPLDGSLSNIPVLVGVVRDESAVWVHPSPGKTMEQYLLDANLEPEVASRVAHSENFPRDGEMEEEVAEYFAAVRITTDASVRCMNQAFASVPDAFKDVWFYETDRGLPIVEGLPQCEPNPSEDFPLGDPSDNTYLRCHGADIAFVFGNINFLGYSDRDGHDIPLSQNIIDYWTQFIRTQDPNGDGRFYKFKGYNSTVRYGRWDSVREGNKVRHLMANTTDVPFGEVEQCAELGLPLDFYTTQLNQVGVS